MNSLHYQVLIQVSLGYPCVRGRLPTRYSPVRRYPLSLLTEISIESFPLDLHVLGTPPAFILSQDQTLNKIVFKAKPSITSPHQIKFELLLVVNALRSFFSCLRNYCFLGIVQKPILPISLQIVSCINSS